VEQTMAILTLKGVITDDGKLQVDVPPDAPRGEVDVTLEFNEVMGIPAADLLASDIVGMWADKFGDRDTIEVADELRARASRRNYEP
jgi:hypothetical protein